jgi:hypothetical protein
MTFLERVRWAVEPDEQRSMSILVSSVAVFIALGGIAAFLPMPRAVNALFALGMLAAWGVGFCGMVGYIRWYLRGAKPPK